MKDAPEAVELLRKLAAKLSESLTWSLPTAQATSLLTIENGPIAATHKAMTAGFLSETGTLLSFSHERFRDYFLAESILTHSSQQNLVAEICRPRNQEAGLFVINALTDPGLVRHCLYILKSPAILQAAYFGDLGPYPKAIIVADIKQLFIMAFKELTGLRIVPETPGKGLYPHYRVEGELAWSTDEVLLLATLSRLIRSGIYFDDFWTLLKATEERLVRTPDDTNRPKASRYRAALEVLVMSRGTCCLTHLLPNPDSAEWPKWQNFGDFWSWQGAARTQLQEKLPILGELTPLELYLVCKLTKDSADWSPDVATAVPEILRLSKRWSIYHLSLECLQLAEYTAHRMDPGPAQETAGVLESLLGNNPFFNSLVFSALAQYKTVETGITSEQVALQLTSILDKPRSEFTCMAAWNIFNAQFEDVFENTFTDAIQNLDPESAIEFRVRAALGSSNLDSSFISILALELLDSESQIAAPAFEKLCVPPVPVSFISDSLAETFILATLGLASLRHPLPERELAEDHSGERAAWLDWRDIIYWMNRTDLPKSERDGHLFFAWERLLAESLEAAVSSWYWIFRYQTSDFAHQRGRLRFNDNFELQLKCLLEKGLFISYETLRLDPFLKRDIVLRMIRCLTCIGDTSTELILRTWVDSEAFGKAAIEAIRVIQERQHGKFT